MRLYFVDTWLLVALVNHLDGDHRRASRLWRELSGSSFVTHDGILSEFLTYFAEYGTFWRKRAVAIARRFLDMMSVEVVAQDRELFLAAMQLYEQRPDKEYSLADCMSMYLMQQRGITHVLTNDHHFRQAGFVVVSDAP